MRTTAYEIQELSQGVYEIGEFDCGSMFLIVGEEKALLVDSGSGIGDLMGALKKLTDKPITLVLTHNHLDHIGHAPLFDEAYIHESDVAPFQGQGDHLPTIETRSWYIKFIAERSGKVYPYELEEDLTEWDVSGLTLLPLSDGQTFDLGGRVVTAYACPGHTPGSMVFLDDKSRILFLGDALNCNLLLAGAPGSEGFISIQTAHRFLKRLSDMGAQYDCYFNGHYDYRSFGEPLGADVMPDALSGMEALISGDYQTTFVKSPLPIFPDREMMVVGRTMIAFTPEGILDAKD